MNKEFTDADYERMVRERDEALARVDSQRSQIAFYRTACTARFLPEGFGDETIRELIKELAEERDEARALVDELRGQYQYSVGLSMALEERDQARRERDEWRDKFHALNQTAGEICNTCGWAFRIPGEPCRCEVVRERDEARAEVERLKAQRLERHLENWEQYMHDNDVKRAYRRGAEAMREACLGVVERFMDFGSPHPGMIAHKMSALPIPEET